MWHNGASSIRIRWLIFWCVQTCSPGMSRTPVEPLPILVGSNPSGNHCTPSFADTCWILLRLAFDAESVIIISPRGCLVPQSRHANGARFLHEIGHNWKLHHAGGPFASQDLPRNDAVFFAVASFLIFLRGSPPLSLAWHLFASFSRSTRSCLSFCVLCFSFGCVCTCENRTQNMHPLVTLVHHACEHPWPKPSGPLSWHFATLKRSAAAAA